MTVVGVATIVLVVVAVAATVLVARATVAFVRLQAAFSERQAVLDKQAKGILRKCAATEATAARITNRVYRYQEQIDVLMLDPKVQAALNRHENG